MLSNGVVESGYVLSCVAYPRSDCHVRIILEEEPLSLQLLTTNGIDLHWKKNRIGGYIIVGWVVLWSTRTLCSSAAYERLMRPSCRFKWAKGHTDPSARRKMKD